MSPAAASPSWELVCAGMEADTSGGPALTGRRFVPAAIGCWYPPAVDAGDVLEVDFDVHQLRSDGLYLIEHVRDGRVTWRGCRRFQRVPGSWWIDDTGRGEWRQLGQREALRYRVVGEVRQRYKPAP